MDSGNYLEIEISVPAGHEREMLIARLDGIGFDGFEETDTVIRAYIAETLFNQPDLTFIADQAGITYSKSVVKRCNWNLIWEANFSPVRVDTFVGIRAGFHPPFGDVAHELIITPKMSFGTGHHATTYLMIQLMQTLALEGSSVLDFGTGTGILAILAEKLGAASVLAIDNDSWCIENASENILVNVCDKIDIQMVELLKISDSFNYILANINKHIILENVAILHSLTTKGGRLVVSGLLQEDGHDILMACKRQGLEHECTKTRDGWIAMVFRRI